MHAPLICKKRLSIAIASVIATTAVAQEQPKAQQPTLMNQVTVTATRTERELDDVASSVSVVTAEDAERNMAGDIRDLVRYEPGVSVSSDSRFGNGSFNIRGMDENRVKISVDGVSQAKSFGYDKSLQSQRNFFDIENMKQLEVVKGPASSVHGSDAIGGVVAFVTKDPADYLNAEGDDTYASIKAGYSSADSSFSETMTLANRSGDLESLLVYTRRDGNERKSYGGVGGKGEGREQADPLDYSSNSLLGKVQYQINDDHRIGFTGEWQDNRSTTDLLSQDGYTVVNGTPSFGHKRVYSDMTGDDKAERKRLGFFHEYDGNNQLFDDMKWSFNWQDSVSTQRTDDHFFGCAIVFGQCIEDTNKTREKTYSYSEESLQFDAVFNKFFELGTTQNYLTYGADIANTSYGNDNKTVSIDHRDNDSVSTEYENWMPQIDMRQYGVFAQNEISLMDDRWTITPGIRYDRFEEKIKSTDYYEGDATDKTYDSWTARLGTVYEFNDTWSAFAQYSQGFATPDMFSKYFNYR